MRQWLRDIRVKSRLTQQELADIVGKDITTIGKYENGQRRPSVATAKKIAEVFNFDWTRFYDDEANVS